MKKVKTKNGMLHCKICGTRFPAIAKNHYIVIAKSGISAIVCNDYYDAFDCPFCGCQIRVGLRMTRSEVTKDPINEEA